jgi:hypothetical protein
MSVTKQHDERQLDEENIQRTLTSVVLPRHGRFAVGQHERATVAIDRGQCEEKHVGMT